MIIALAPLGSLQPPRPGGGNVGKGIGMQVGADAQVADAHANTCCFQDEVPQGHDGRSDSLPCLRRLLFQHMHLLRSLKMEYLREGYHPRILSANSRPGGFRAQFSA
jgi:hypothetical protein